MSDEAAADAQFMAKMIEMENMLRSFFELADVCAERKRYVDALHVEYEERVQKGTEKDPEFVNRFESCPSQVHTPIFIMTETYDEEEQHVNALRQNRLWVFASDEDKAMKGLRRYCRHKRTRSVAPSRNFCCIRTRNRLIIGRWAPKITR